MKPYLTFFETQRDKQELLRHAAAYTDDASHVAGAKQAVDRITDAIRL
ncbi:hypothetical protein [Phyllobacterium sp. SB3]